MAQIIGIIFMIGFLTFAFQVALAFLLLAGLIFRTKETIGLLFILGAFAAFNAHPVLGSILIVILLGYALYKNVIASPEEDEVDETT